MRKILMKNFIEIEITENISIKGELVSNSPFFVFIVFFLGSFFSFEIF